MRAALIMFVRFSSKAPLRHRAASLIRRDERPPLGIYYEPLYDKGPMSKRKSQNPLCNGAKEVRMVPALGCPKKWIPIEPMPPKPTARLSDVDMRSYLGFQGNVHWRVHPNANQRRSLRWDRLILSHIPFRSANQSAVLRYEFPRQFHHLQEANGRLQIAALSEEIRDLGVEMSNEDRALSLWLVLDAQLANPRFVLIGHDQRYDRAQVAPDHYWIPIAHVQPEIRTLFFAPLRKFIPAATEANVQRGFRVEASNPLRAVML